MEWRRCLADFLAVPAGELLPHRLDHLPLTRHRFQRPGYVFAELAQTIAAAAFARRRRIDHHPLARKVVWERVALSAIARKSDKCRCFGDCLLRRQFVFRRVRFQFFEGKRQLIDQPRRAFRFLAVNLALELRYPQGLPHNQRVVLRRLARATASSAFSAAFCSARAARSASMRRSES